MDGGREQAMAPAQRDRSRQWPAGPGGNPVAAGADRSTRFFARLDAHLPTLADDRARGAFLDTQLAGWEHRYARFVATDGTSEPVCDPADPPQAADFLLTLIGLAARRGALAACLRWSEFDEKGTTPMTDRPAPVPDRAADKLIGSAILSLLVAADQRCPAIIGQAHLLYHARSTTTPEHAARTFAQLKRDANDLAKAIADVEAAVKEARRW
jgi:hypothetical protein